MLAAFSQKHGITYPLLSDVGSEVITRFGIRNTVADEALATADRDSALMDAVRVYATVLEPSERLRGVPYPGTFIVDRDGRVTSRFFEDFYRERSTAESILLRLGLGGAAVHGTKIQASHVDISTYPSDATVVAGTRFAVVVKLAPHRDVHVYAPGASGSRPVALHIDAQPHVRTLPVRYPPAVIHRFPELNEEAPVYQEPITLLADVVVEATADAQKAFADKTELALTGTLEYQACDNTTCYEPVVLPLSWTVALTRLTP